MFENMEKLDALDEGEILAICKYVDVDIFLGTIKKKGYEKYTKKLGRLDKKSALVHKLLPQFAFDLYKKGDSNFEKAVVRAVSYFKIRIEKDILLKVEPAVSIELIKSFDVDKLARLYYQIMDASTTEISIEMFFAFMKLEEIFITDDERDRLINNINQLGKVRELTVQLQREHIHEMEQLTKNLHREFDAEKNGWRNEKKRLKESIQESKEIILELREENRKLTDQINQDRDKQIAVWRQQYKTELEAEKRENIQKIEEAYQQAKREFTEYRQQLETEYEEKKTDLEQKLDNQISEAKKQYGNQMREISQEIDDLSLKRKQINECIELLETKKEELQTVIEHLNSYEDNYFETFDQRIIEHKIDVLLMRKLGLLDGMEMSHSNSHSGTRDELRGVELDGSIITKAKTISKNMEYSDDIQDLEDFIADFKDNISLNFDESLEIAAIIMATIINGKNMIVAEGVSEFITTALSALVNLSTPLVVDMSAENSNLRNVVEVINSSDSDVVYIKGLLDNYNEMYLTSICKECPDKYIFFGVSSLSNLQLLSKNILNYTVVLDIEDYLHFPDEELMLVADYDIRNLLVCKDIKSCKSIYKKYFKKLFDNRLIGQRSALDYSSILQVYFTIIADEIIGDIMQQGIMEVCNLERCEDAEEILRNCGINISTEKRGKYNE